MLFGIRWGSLRIKIIAWSFIPAAIILGGVALVTLTAYQRVTEDLVIERDQEVTRLSASQLSAELAEYANLLEVEARTVDLFGDSPSAQRDALRRASNRLAAFDAGVLVLDTFGTVVAAHPDRPEILGQGWSEHAIYQETLHAKVWGTSGPLFSDIVPDGPDGAEVVAVVVQITSPQGEFVGMLAGMFRVGATAVSAFYGEIVKLHLEGSGGAYLVDKQGRVIYHADPERIGEDVSAQPVVQQVLAGEVGAIRTQDLEGREIVASFAPIPGTSWGLVSQESWTRSSTPVEGTSASCCCFGAGGCDTGPRGGCGCPATDEADRGPDRGGPRGSRR